MTDKTDTRQEERKPRSTSRRLITGGLIGIVVGLGVSWLSGQLGSSCSIMCNPYIAVTLGAVLGGSMAISE